MKSIELAHPKVEDQAALSHALARSAFRLTIPAARLLHVALSQLRPKDSGLPTVEMSVGEIIRALCLDDSKSRYDEIRAAADSLMGQVIHRETSTGWEKFHLVEKARYIKDGDIVELKLSEEIKDLVVDLQGFFTLISNGEISQISSEYGVRIFQLLMSWKDKAGKDGNKPNEWWWKVELSHLKKILEVPPTAYSGPDGTWNFKVNVVRKPIAEINKAALGLSIEIQDIKQGRNLVGFQFNCKLTPKGERNATPARTKEERLVQKMRETSRWRTIYAELGQRPQTPIKGMPEVDSETEELLRIGDADRIFQTEKKTRQTSFPGIL